MLRPGQAQPMISSEHLKSGKNLLFLRPIRRANMLMTQVPQHLPVILAHPAREVRITQVPIARGLRHILQHAQPVLDSSLPVRR
jgi:hypothetical protein